MITTLLYTTNKSTRKFTALLLREEPGLSNYAAVFEILFEFKNTVQKRQCIGVVAQMSTTDCNIIERRFNDSIFAVIQRRILFDFKSTGEKCQYIVQLLKRL